MRKARKMQEALDILVGKQAFSPELQVKGDFFLIGSFKERDRNLVIKINEQGHGEGNRGRRQMKAEKLAFVLAEG